MKRGRSHPNQGREEFYLESCRFDHYYETFEVLITKIPKQPPISEAVWVKHGLSI